MLCFALKKSVFESDNGIYGNSPISPTKKRDMSKSKFQQMTAAQFRAKAPEWSIQSAIVGLLKVVGLPHSVTDSSLIFDDKGKVSGRGVLCDGWPDVTVSLPPAGRLLGIETKSLNGTLRPAQIKCHAELRNAGATCIKIKKSNI
jgi:hypothetical protein